MEKELTKEELAEVSLASLWNQKFKESMVTKSPYTKRWANYWDAYYGDYFKNQNLPDYKSDAVSNYIFSIIETIRPIMLDNDPKFQALARQPEGQERSQDVQEALSYEWDRERMSKKLYRELITTLVTGTTPFFIPWDKDMKNVRAIPFSPDNLFPDPLATGVDDAEYLIYASYKHEDFLKKIAPEKADRIHGGQVNYGELVYGNNKNAKTETQVLVLEVYYKPYSFAKEVTKLVVAPEIGVVFEHRKSPYNDGEFPFELLKDYEVPGKFWGEGEVAQLLSPQKIMNDLNNAIVDNAKATANLPWIIDRNSGIGEGKITNRPGLIIRKNPGTQVERPQAPSMPSYVAQAVDTFKNDMEQVSGIFDSIKGNSETGVYTAQGILALQEAGQARIRLKVKLMEDFLSRLATLWYSRMKQFWTEDRFINVVHHDGTYDVKQFKRNTLDYDYDIRITAGSTMPVNRGAMLDLMIRLAQTQMPDGQNLVDRDAVVQYLPEEAKSAILKRMGKKNLQVEQQMEQINMQLQQVQQNDQETLGSIEQLVGAVEKINQQIIQLQKEHDMLESEKKKEEEMNKIKTTSYNEGYNDAEQLAKPLDSDTQMNGEGSMQGLGSESGTDVAGGLPDDIMTGLEDMSDDELQLLMEKNPDLLELINGASV